MDLKLGTNGICPILNIFQGTLIILTGYIDYFNNFFQCMYTFSQESTIFRRKSKGLMYSPRRYRPFIFFAAKHCKCNTKQIFTEGIVRPFIYRYLPDISSALSKFGLFSLLVCDKLPGEYTVVLIPRVYLVN